MLARRFSCPPVHEAVYEPREVPNCNQSDMSSTLIIRPTREEWLQLLGEMVQITNEAVRRRASCARDASKPLSLEYMADRIDVDEPLFGYLAVTKDKGWMQGFVTCTTFTTWHRRFRWDSTNPCVDLRKHGDEEPADGDTPNSPDGSSEGRTANAEPPATNATDADGSLAVDLMREVHAGNPENEGVVWPRVAELSLLGALGCGRWLVQLILDGLETKESPYHFVVAQATDSSIPFYERMGFVRVGAVTATRRADGVGGPGANLAGRKRKKGAGDATDECGDVTSRCFEYVTAEGETCAKVAAKFAVEPFDVLFLNQRCFPRLHQHAELKPGTRLLIPQEVSREEVIQENAKARDGWHVVECDAPLKKIAETLGVQSKELLEWNRPSIKGLQLSSILRHGTRIRSAPVEYEYDEYCHWSFPEDDPSSGCPSYMMARRLRPHSERSAHLDKASVLARTKALLASERPTVVPTPSRMAVFEAVRKAKAMEQEAAAASEFASTDGDAVPPLMPEPPRLFNRVVSIDGESDKYRYWYVLTYLPDLQWCHVAPLTTRGVFEQPGPSHGRPRWMLVSEEEGGEIDVGAGRCRIMEAIEMKSTPENADDEEWDILEPAK